jgi:hypothetical protein
LTHTNHERDLKTRQAALEDHSVWLLQRAAWGSEAEGWLRRLDDHAKTLDQLRAWLDREGAHIAECVENGAVRGPRLIFPIDRCP